MTSIVVSPRTIRSPASDDDRLDDPRAVQLGPVPRAEVRQDEPLGLLLEARVDAGERPVREEDVVRGGPAEREGRAVDPDAADRLAGGVDREDQHERRV